MLARAAGPQRMAVAAEKTMESKGPLASLQFSRKREPRFNRFPAIRKASSSLRRSEDTRASLLVPSDVDTPMRRRN